MDPSPAPSPAVPALIRQPDAVAVCRLAPDAPVAPWMHGGALSSITRTPQELSVICAAPQVPAGVRHEGPFAVFMVEGPLPFTMTGVLARISAPLADAGIPIVVLSTFDTDYILIAVPHAAAAVAAWTQAGLATR